VLDLTRVAGQVYSLVSQLRDGAAERGRHREQALSLMQDKSLDFDSLKRKAASSKTSWLVAVPAEPLQTHLVAPNAPAEHTILATDGSQIDVDRHQSARCYLINIGRVRLDYGAQPDARLESLPRLATGSELILSDGLHEQPIEGNLLAIRRAIAELEHLAQLAGELPPSRPALALVDGSLILWGLTGEKYPDFILTELLDKGYLKALEDLRVLSRERRLALASYISFPRSTDVVNTLRLALCPHEVADCDRRCNEVSIGQRPCARVAGVQDRDLFETILGDGERSALFITQSKIVRDHYPAPVYFFYLKASEEITRVEVPEWVALDKKRLDLAQSLILDQSRRGQGYPVALSESHEQAVVTGADRENFQQMLEIWLTEEHLPTATSAKSRSKKTRWV
jgi:hypothetical protein